MDIKIFELYALNQAIRFLPPINSLVVVFDDDDTLSAKHKQAKIKIQRLSIFFLIL